MAPRCPSRRSIRCCVAARAEEIVACLEGGRFRSAIIAPAFPAQGRITRGGRQYWRPAGRRAWQPVDLDLLLELRRSLPIVHAEIGQDARGRRVLPVRCRDRGAAACDRRRPAGAWQRPCCGAAAPASRAPWPGPARSRETFVPKAPLLMLIGSDACRRARPARGARGPMARRSGHPASRGRRSRMPGRMSPRRSAGRSSAALAVALPEALARSGPAGAGRKLRAARRADASAGQPVRHRRRDPAWPVAGARVRNSLLATGELLPGVPHARIVGGRWHDLPVISKSGGFGAPDLLIRLAESVMP